MARARAFMAAGVRLCADVATGWTQNQVSYFLYKIQEDAVGEVQLQPHEPTSKPLETDVWRAPAPPDWPNI